MWNLDETAVRVVPSGERGWTTKSRVTLCLRLARLRHGHARCEHEERHVDTDRLRGEERPSTPSQASVPLPARVPLPDALDHARGTLEHDRNDGRGHARAPW